MKSAECTVPVLTVGTTTSQDVPVVSLSLTALNNARLSTGDITRKSARNSQEK